MGKGLKLGLRYYPEQEAMHESIIRHIPLFAALPLTEIQLLSRSLREVDLAPDALLFREGDTGDSLYIVVDGIIEVIKLLGTPDERRLAVHTRGEFVGEMSLLAPQGRRTASVKASTTTRLLEMSRADFDVLLQRQPGVAYDLARVLGFYLQEANLATIRDLQHKNRELTEAYQALQAAQAQIIEKERLERELQVAQEIQLSIVPRHKPRLEGFELGARMLPARTVGGDFFDFLPLGPDMLGVVIGDVCGKGVPAALFMALTCSLVRAEASRSAQPREVLEAVNRHLLAMNDTGMFVTMLYGVLRQATRQFEYARAGHELPLLLAGGRLSRAPQKPGHPLACLPKPALDEQTVHLPPGSMLLLYTDGVTDATAADGELYSLERFKDAVTTMQNANAQSICDEVVNQVLQYSAGAEQADDITVVTVCSV